MKLGLWILLLAFFSWSVDGDFLVRTAYAGMTVSKVGTKTTTVTAPNGAVFTQTEGIFVTLITTDTNTSGPHTSTGATTDTNCTTGGSQYGGGQWNWCNRTDPTQQKNSQNDNKDLNNNGADQSSMLGMAAIAAGMAMVAAGMALLPNPPTTPIGMALIAAGMALIAAGMAALAAASQMNKNADKSGYNGQNLDNLNPYKSSITTPADGSGASGDTGKADVGQGNGGGIKIDPALTRTGKLDTIFSDMENKTGLNREAMMNAIGSGQNPLDLLASSPAVGKMAGGSSANLQKMMDDTMAKGNLPNGQEMMDKLGLTPGDLGAGNGGAGGRNLASTGPNIDSLFPSTADAKPEGKSAGTAMGISSEVQAALDRNGITGRSIFEMIHAQYTRRTPQMFGVQHQKDGTAANPFETDKTGF